MGALKIKSRSIDAPLPHRFAVDALLRRHGWRIHSRAVGRDALWQRKRNVVAERMAVAALPLVELAQAHLDEIAWLENRYSG